MCRRSIGFYSVLVGRRKGINRFSAVAAQRAVANGLLWVSWDPLAIGRLYGYSVGLHALRSTRLEGVQACVRKTLTRYGLPEALLLDHGVP